MIITPTAKSHVYHIKAVHLLHISEAMYWYVPDMQALQIYQNIFQYIINVTIINGYPLTDLLSSLNTLGFFFLKINSEGLKYFNHTLLTTIFRQYTAIIYQNNDNAH